MAKNKRLTIMIFGDDMAEHRQMQISTRTIKGVVLSAILLVVSAVLFAGLWLREGVHAMKLETLKGDNEALRAANERYLNATVEIEKKLKQFDSKTHKLATLVGVNSQDLPAGGGLGGAELLDHELNQYLRRDLALIQDECKIIEQRLETLDEAFMTRSEVLDSTPSLLPAKGWLSSGFAYRIDPFTKKRAWHPGIDLSCSHGTPVFVPANGVVVSKGYRGGLGNLLEISHGNGILTRYGHLWKFNVAKGQRVQRGDLIGYVGTTGRSTGPHLHFELHKNGKAVDPLKYIIEDVKPY